MFQFINNKSGDVDQVKLCDVKSIRIFEGNNDFVLFMKNCDIIQGTQYLLNSPNRIFIEHFKTLVSDSIRMYEFNEIIGCRKAVLMSVGNARFLLDKYTHQINGD